MRKLSFVLLLAAGCGAPITPGSGAAACITAAACNLLLGDTSGCTEAVATINDPQYELLYAVSLGGSPVKISPSQVNCIAAAGSDCTRAKACLDNGMTPAPCTGTSSTCMGSLVVMCGTATGSGGNNGQQVYDCSTLGGGYTCVAGNGTVDCGTASCGGGATTQCNGNILQRCNNGVMEQVDCSQFNATCVSTGIESHCRGKGNACSQPVTQPFFACQGSVLRICADGQEADYDCARLGVGCFTAANGNGFACRAGNDCDPGNFTSSCSNNVLTFCNNGKHDTFNCSSAGYTGCDAQKGTCTK